MRIGDQLGKAAPGEYGPRALLRTPGQFVGTRDGLTPSGLYAPGHLLATPDFGGAGISNVTTETSLLSGVQTNLFPAGVAVGDAVQIKAAGTLKSTSVAQTAVLNLYMGSTIIASATSASIAATANPRSWYLDVEVIYKVIGGGGVGSIIVLGEILIGTGTGGAWQSQLAVGDNLFNDAVAQVIATNAAANCDLKGTMGASGGTVTMVCNVFRARYLPKNY